MARKTKGNTEATPTTTPKTKEVEMDVVQFHAGRIDVCIVGRSPLICNRMANKGALLLPPRKKNKHERETTLKHEPRAEFRRAPYLTRDPKAPTMLLFPSTAFKNALRCAAIDTAGSSKAEIGRLTYVEGEYVNLYGIPKLHMMPVRSADMRRTPDIRTRATVREWACRLSVSYMRPKVAERTVLALLANAGLIQGVGDGRPEKGWGTYGQFELVAPNDPRFLAIVKSGGRAAQADAMEHPEPYDEETAELLAWFDEEVAKRSMGGASDDADDEDEDDEHAHMNGASPEVM